MIDARAGSSGPAPLPMLERGSGSPLVLVHGFAQNARCWAPLDERWAADRHVIAVDAPGHGGDGEHSQRADDLWCTADRLAITGGRAVYLGYSMGARMCLHLAIAHPESVAGLVLVSGTAGIDDDAERVARRGRDGQLAERIVADGVDAFLETWLNQPLLSTVPTPMRHLEERRRNRAEGLASSLRMAGTGTMDPPLWDRLGEITAPTLVVAGELDAKFVELGRRIAEGIPDSTLSVVEGAGHTVHLERPEMFARLLAQWLVAKRL